MPQNKELIANSGYGLPETLARFTAATGIKSRRLCGTDT
jgi:hypothetical protein